MRTYANMNVVNASRKVWLAGLGAAVVTRDWAQTGGPAVFRNLVKEGTLVESRTIRVVGDRLESSITVANRFLRRARSGVAATVKRAADSAATLVSNNLPNVQLPAMFAPPKAKPAAKRTRKARVVKTAKRAPRRKARAAK